MLVGDVNVHGRKCTQIPQSGSLWIKGNGCQDGGFNLHVTYDYF